jgi:toxin ParE1/3/4
MKVLIIDPLAEAELIDALVHHAREWANNGRNLHAEFIRLFSDISQDPKAFPTYRWGYRFATLKPYVVYFLELPQMIWVVSVSHERRRLNHWRKRQPPREPTP